MVELIVRTSKRSVNRTLEVHLQLREAVEKKENTTERKKKVRIWIMGYLTG